MTLPIEWVDEPPPVSPRKAGTNGKLWTGIAAGILMTQPGRWARVRTSRAVGNALNGLRSLGCEAVSRYEPELGGISIYARYIGEEGS